ncbi:outer membrane protein assembly factor BamE [Lacibacterium aquatile]|uniref:Outer membrane protein assembly factor BamE n=1 Tax=Lacibacterium aquatile TaxID=1168082 RepID=A0ABW5DT08_9PROT
MRRFVFAAIAVAGLSGCSQNVDVRGNEVELETVEVIRPGVHTRSDIVQLIGSPTVMSTFNDKNWYYISRRTQTTAFFKPETIEQQVVTVSFDEQGVVSDVALAGMESKQEVAHVSRTTPTSGHSLTLLEQLFGNLGRFNSGKPVYQAPGGR